MKKLFLSHCTEFERGWGQRPDGFMISDSIDAMQEEIKKQHAKGSYMYYWRYGEPIEIYCEENTFQKKIVPRMSDTNNVAFFKEYENIDVELYKRI